MGSTVNLHLSNVYMPCSLKRNVATCTLCVFMLGISCLFVHTLNIIIFPNIEYG